MINGCLRHRKGVLALETGGGHMGSDKEDVFVLEKGSVFVSETGGGGHGWW